MAALLVMVGLSPLLAWARETQCMHTLGGELLWCGRRKSTLVSMSRPCPLEIVTPTYNKQFLNT